MQNKEDLTKYIIWIFIFLLIFKPSFIFWLIFGVVFLFPVFLAIKEGSRKKGINLNFSGMKDGKQYFSSDNSNQFINKLSSKIMDKKTTSTVVVIVLSLIVLAKSIVIIPAGETGIYHLFGKVKDSELKSGFHIVNPLAEVTKLSIRTEQYTMSVVKEEGQKAGDDSIDALTNEGLTVKLDITVFYHLVEDKASDVYKELGIDYQGKIIRPEIRSAIREVVAGYDSKSIYSEKRDEMIIKIKESMTDNIEPRGIAIEQVLLRNVILPAKLDSSIQEKLQAEQESQRYDFILEKEKKEADRKRIEAEGQRDAQKTINESLTSGYLNYLYIKELKDREGTIYIPTNAENGMPMFKGIQ
ncbi:MAG: prohibitin family protein [Candidatus Andersenbacteria bacterium]|nr:prohibitin family protein [Candidatus Andersenbacteria bacterium]